MAQPFKVHIFAPPQATASNVFGLYDALNFTGRGWEEFITGERQSPVFDVRIVGLDKGPFDCASGTVLTPHLAATDATGADVVIMPGMNLSASERPVRAARRAWDWLSAQHAAGARVVSACTGAIYLAEAGLLDGIEATTHWAFADLFRSFYPRVRLRLERCICYQEARRGIVTAGGTTAWQELALFLIASYGSAEHAANAAKFWLMADRSGLQSPFMTLVHAIPHGDAAIEAAQIWIGQHYAVDNPVAGMSEQTALAPTTFARRFRKATGMSPQSYVQAVRVEEAKQLLESTQQPVDTIAAEVGYEDTASFRRIFKRRTGLSPSEHRRMFGAQRFTRFT